MPVSSGIMSPHGVAEPDPAGMTDAASWALLKLAAGEMKETC
jgi:hypothetical protein